MLSGDIFELQTTYSSSRPPEADTEHHPQQQVDLDQDITPGHGQSQHAELSTSRAGFVYVAAAGISFVASMSTGLLTTGLPSIATDLNLSEGLLLWPASIYGLTGGCTFIATGAIADVVGSKKIYLFGCLFLGVCILACGVAKTGTQLIIFRGLQGVAASCCLPTAISILTRAFRPGRRRTRGLALQGAAQPIGFSAGLFLGGLFADTIGWRWGWYITAMLSIGVFAIGFWAIAPDPSRQQASWKRIFTEVDWIGALMISLSLGLISYVLAVTASDSAHIREPVNIALLCLAIVLIPAFAYWMHRQEQSGKATLIPNSVWRNRYFTAICAMVFLGSMVLNVGEYFFSLFFQKVQLLSALQASLRFLPNIIIGTLISFGTDAVLHKWSSYPYVTAMSLISAIAPLLMGLMQPQWPYWYMAFWAMALLPFANDVLFIVGAIIITDSFSAEKQALAGSILNTAFQFGSAVGLGVMAVASSVVTSESESLDKGSPPALLDGYRATFWSSLGLSIIYCSIAAVGLKGIGKIGLKSE